MEETLKDWNLGDLVERFQGEKITIEMFSNLVEQREALKELLPKVGDRLIFQEKVKEMENHNIEGSQTSSQIDASLKENRQENGLDITTESSCNEVPVIIELDSSIAGSSFSTSTPLLFELGKESPNFDSDQALINIPDECDLPIKKQKNIHTFLLEFDLKELLNKSAVGKALISWYDIKGGLDSTRQSYLVEIISTEILNRNFSHLSNLEFEILSKKIIQLFPSEITESYYLPPIRKRDSLDNKPGVAKGKLVDKFRNKLTFLREAGILPSRNSKDSNNPKQDLQTDAEADDEHLKWLRYNREPLSEVFNHWDETFTARRQKLLREGGCTDEIFEQYPILKDQVCLSLVQRDFERIFPNKSDTLINSWEVVIHKLITLRSQFVSAESDKILLDLLQSGTLHDDYKHYVMLMLLASLLPNKSRHVYGRSRKYWRPTIVDTRNGIVLRAELSGDIETKVKAKTEKLAHLDIQVQPFIVVEGSGTSIRKVYVYINGQLYTVASVLKGIDFCFKAYHVFHLRYQTECENIWNFVQHALYEIKTKWDNSIPYILDIANKIKK